MAKSIPAVFTALTVMFITALALVFVFRMEQRRAENLRARETEFRRVVQRLEAAYREGEPPASPTTREIIRAHLEDPRGPRVFAVYNYDDGLEYLWTYSPAYIRTGVKASVSVPGLPAFSYNDLTEGQISRQVRGVEDDSWIVDAIYPLLLGPDFFVPLRDTLIALVAFALITALAAAAGARRELRSAAREPRFETGAGGPTSAPLSRRLGAAPPEPARPSTERPVVPEISEPAQRIDAALQRAAAEDENLALALVQFPTAVEPEEIAQAFRGEVEVLDLERGRYALVLPGLEITDALRRCERLQTEWAAQYGIPPPTVGLTARNGRLVSAVRLIKEAQVALRRAERGPRRITAFSADPNRFRDFVFRKDRA